MRLLSAFALSLSLVSPAFAGVDDALSDHILPGFERFAQSTGDLAQTAESNCTAAALRPAFHAAFDAWMTVADLRLGPSETGALSIAFWPDARGLTPRTLRRLIAENDPVTSNVAGYAEVSIAARGLFALEMLIYDPEFAAYSRDSLTCDLAATVAGDLDIQAKSLAVAWRDTYADTLRTAGQPGNTTYLGEDEALRAIYTQILSSLEFTADRRLGQPMGTFDRPRPASAEARRSGRSLLNVLLASEAAHVLATELADWPLPESDAAMAEIRNAVARIEDPAFQDVTDPAARLRAEVLQQAVRSLHDAIQTEIGARLGIAAGFNSQDGD